MTPRDVIKNTIDTGHEVLNAYLSDFTDTDLMVRAVAGTNHVAWQLGHLISSEHQMLTDGGYKMPDLPTGFADSYTKESAASDDEGKFHKKEQYLGWMQEQRAATLAALTGLSDADLDKPTPQAMHDYAPTVGALFNIIGIHEMMHAAQFVAVRRKLGKPVMI